MPRLIEYISLIGVAQNETDLTSNIESNMSIDGSVIWRAPANDHDDFPFPEGLPLFCMPNGWKTQTQARRPLFYSAVLTGLTGEYTYAANILWNQYITTKNENGKAKTLTDLYIPKCLCIVSRMPFFDNFQDSLNLIFLLLWDSKENKYSDDSCLLAEKVMSRLLSTPNNINFGTNPLKLSLYKDYDLEIVPPMTSQIQPTKDSLVFLIRHLGISNFVQLLTAILLDNKVIFYSHSYNFLFQACGALSSALFPFKFKFVYIPLLPVSLSDVVSAPTPFMIGVHGRNRIDFESISDVVVANLDTGKLTLSEQSMFWDVPEFFRETLCRNLSLIMYPQLESADELFYGADLMTDTIKDKYLRASVLYFFLDLLKGYFACISIVRLLPTVVVKFQRNLFLERRQFMKHAFVEKFLQTMIFDTFVSERGIPYRKCDFFDALSVDILDEDNLNVDERSKKYISIIADVFIQNEYCKTEQTAKLFSDVTYSTNAFYKCKLRDIKIDLIKIDSNLVDKCSKTISRSSNMIANMDRTKSVVSLNETMYNVDLIFDLDVLTKNIVIEFINYIFDYKTSRAVQMLPKMISISTVTAIRLLFCNQLTKMADLKYTCLTKIQFNILRSILNKFLEVEKRLSCYSTSYIIIEIAHRFYYNLNNMNIFLYTQLQNQDMWERGEFWESAFYLYVQLHLRTFYVTNNIVLKSTRDLDKTGSFISTDSFDVEEANYADSAVKISVYYPHYTEIISSVPILAQKSEMLCGLKPEEIESISSLELNAISSIANLFISRIMFMRLKISEALRYNQKIGDTIGESQKTNDLIPTYSSEKCDVESIIKFIEKFITNISKVVDFNYETIQSLKSKVKEIMKLHCDSLVRLYIDEQNASIDFYNDTKIPNFLLKEKLMFSIKGYLFPDYMHYNVSSRLNNCEFLPAQGTLLLTDYRLLFLGVSVNSYASDITVSHGMPLGLIRKVKTINSSFLPGIYEKKISSTHTLMIYLKNAQIIIIGINQSVESDRYESFTKYINKRNTSLIASLRKPSSTDDNLVTIKNDSSKGSSTSPKNQPMLRAMKKLHILTMKKPLKKKMTTIKSKSSKVAQDKATILKSEISVVEKKINSHSGEPIYEGRSVEYHISDYKRLHIFDSDHYELIDKTKQCWRLLSINENGNIVPSYPETFPIPFHYSDENITRVSKFFKLGCLPILSWRENLNRYSKYANFEDFNAGSALFRSGAVLKGISALTNSNKSKTSNSPAYNDAESYFLNLISIASKYKRNLNSSRDDSDKNSLYSRILEKTLSAHQLFIPNTNEYLNFRETLYTFSQLYIIGDKTYAKGVTEDNSLTSLNADLPDQTSIKRSFNKLAKSLFYGKAQNMVMSQHLAALATSEWFTHISRLLEISSVSVFLLEHANCYCSIGFGDGSDHTAQISSLTQLLIDPYYRTIKGFFVLITKEWISFKHRFLNRNGMLSDNYKLYTPYFLLFMDCVYQIHCQFPESFEFNNYFLKYITHHSVSNRFHNFIVTSAQKMDESLVAPDVALDNAESSHTMDDESIKFDSQVDLNENAIDTEGLINDSIWDYIDKFNNSTYIFYNSCYIKNAHKTLYVNSHLSQFEVWDYYFCTSFLTEKYYDLEESERRESNVSSNSKTKSSTVNVHDSIHYNYIFYDGSAYVGYELSNTNKVIDKVILKLDNLNEKKRFMNTASVEKEFTLKKIEVADEYNQNKNNLIGDIDISYFFYINSKDMLINLIQKGKSYLPEKDKFSYFNLLLHNFVENVAIDEVICMHCHKTIEKNFNSCSMCNQNYHIKCSKLIDQSCYPNFLKMPISQLGSVLSCSNTVKKSKGLLNHLNSNTSNLGFKKKPSVFGTLKMPGTLKLQKHKSNTLDPSLELKEKRSSSDSVSGFLYKLGTKFNLKHKKYYVINQNYRALLAYKDIPTENNEAQDLIDLIGLLSCSILNVSDLKVSKLSCNLNDIVDGVDKKSKVFELVTHSNKKIRFAAPSSDLCSMWVDSFNKIINDV